MLLMREQGGTHAVRGRSPIAHEDRTIKMITEVEECVRTMVVNKEVNNKGEL